MLQLQQLQEPTVRRSHPLQRTMNTPNSLHSSQHLRQAAKEAKGKVNIRKARAKARERMAREKGKARKTTTCPARAALAKAKAKARVAKVAKAKATQAHPQATGRAKDTKAAKATLGGVGRTNMGGSTSTSLYQY